MLCPLNATVVFKVKDQIYFLKLANVMFFKGKIVCEADKFQRIIIPLSGF